MRASNSFLAAFERTMERSLKLEHGANAIPLFHVVCYYVFFATLAIHGVVTSTLLRAVLWILFLLLNYSLTIGVLHMHAHRKLFTSRRANRVLEYLLCFPSCLPFPVMQYAHTYIHHRFENGAGDFTSTRGYERGWKAVWYWISYGYRCTTRTRATLFDPHATPHWRNLRSQYVLDAVMTTVLVIAYVRIDPVGALYLYLIPLVITHINSSFFAWLTHAPAGDGPLDESINTVNNLMGLFIFNQGYHAVHHRHPGIHWTDIPSKLDLLLDVDSRYIVRYWVTMPAALRLLRPDGFLDAEHGDRWKARYHRRKGRVRWRFLPYFAWI